MDRIIEIASDNRHLSVERGFMTIEERGNEIGRIALDQISCVIINAHGVTYTNNLLVRLAEQGSMAVICGANHNVSAFVWPIDGHFQQAGRMDAQLSADLPLKKRLWQQIVQSKIKGQSVTLKNAGKPFAPVEALIKDIRSGDPDNIEAQAARRYWPILFGDDFRRDRASEGINAMLNYGYTVLRAITARSVVAVGLHPTPALFHQNTLNPMRLVDDVMEPYRPFIDGCVFQLAQNNINSVCKESKEALAGLGDKEIGMPDGIITMSRAVRETALSLAQCFEKSKTKLSLPLHGTELFD